MYRLREMELDDKVCEQVSMSMLSEVYPTAVIERCVQESEPWSTKARRVRLCTALALVLCVMGMALWSRLNQCQVWHKLVGKLSALHPAEPKSTMSDSGVSGGRQRLGSHCLQALMRQCCQLIAQPASMPSAFFGRYRLMAIDGTIFNTPDTAANTAAFGRSSNQYGPGAYRASCAVCSWPNVAAMGWSGWKSTATMFPKCMGLTVCWSRWVRRCSCSWTRASPRAAFSSMCVSVERMRWEP